MPYGAYSYRIAIRERDCFERLVGLLKEWLRMFASNRQHHGKSAARKMQISLHRAELVSSSKFLDGLKSFRDPQEVCEG